MFDSFDFYIIFVLVFCCFSFVSLAPWLPTRTNDLKRINNIIKLKKGEKFLEIGSGTAKVSLFLAKKNTQNLIIGIELSPFFYLFSKIKIYFSGLKNIKIIYGNALNLDFGDFDVFYIFGLPKNIEKKIFPKLKKQMKKNARFFSYCFAFEDKNNLFIQKKHKETKNVYSIYESKKVSN